VVPLPWIQYPPISTWEFINCEVLQTQVGHFISKSKEFSCFSFEAFSSFYDNSKVRLFSMYLELKVLPYISIQTIWNKGWFQFDAGTHWKSSNFGTADSVRMTVD